MGEILLERPGEGPGGFLLDFCEFAQNTNFNKSGGKVLEPTWRPGAPLGSQGR